MMDSYKQFMEQVSQASVETFTNETKTIYAIVTRQKGMAFAMRPIIGHYGPATCLIVKARAHKEEEWANLDDSNSLFGFPEFLDRSATYKMVPIIIPLVLGFSNSIVVSKLISDNQLIPKVIDTVYTRLLKAGIPEDQLQDRVKIKGFFEEQVANMLPIPKFNVPEDFPVLVGVSSIGEGIIKKSIQEEDIGNMDL